MNTIAPAIINGMPRIAPIIVTVKRNPKNIITTPAINRPPLIFSCLKGSTIYIIRFECAPFRRYSSCAPSNN